MKTLNPIRCDRCCGSPTEMRYWGMRFGLCNAECPFRISIRSSDMFTYLLCVWCHYYIVFRSAEEDLNDRSLHSSGWYDWKFRYWSVWVSLCNAVILVWYGGQEMEVCCLLPVRLKCMFGSMLSMWAENASKSYSCLFTKVSPHSETKWRGRLVRWIELCARKYSIYYMGNPLLLRTSDKRQHHMWSKSC